MSSRVKKLAKEIRENLKVTLFQLKRFG